MNANKNKLYGKALIGAALLLAMTVFCGCKKEEPGKMDKQTVAVVTSDPNAAIEQKLCPVMGNPIDKNVYTVYKGNKVYFCCPMCKPKFEKDPEKYISKLPQFAK